MWFALFIGKEKKGGIHLERIGAVWVTVVERVGVACAVFDLDLAAEAVCVRVFVKMIDLLSSPPHDSHSCVITKTCE